MMASGQAKRVALSSLIHYNELNIIKSEAMKDLHLYLHIPYCQAKCPYCHFFSETPPQATLPLNSYAQYLQQDLIQKKREFSLNNHQVKSIYFGGGTPTLLPIQELSDILFYIQQLWPIAPHCEITVESNPHSLTLIYLKHLLNLGITRLSLGIQTFQPHLQEILQRKADFSKVKELVTLCQEKSVACGLDFIYGLPEQNLDDLRADLQLIQELPLSHLSFYELELHEGTPIKDWKDQQKYNFPEQEQIIEMYQLLYQELKKQGWEHYEISNYAKNKQYSQHNLNFWLGNDYLGAGASAGSRLYAQSVQNNHNLKNPPDKQTFTKAENTIQYLMGRLRLNIGLDFKDFETGLAEQMQKLAGTWPAVDFQENNQEKLILNENGWLKYDYYLNELAQICYDYYGES